MSAVNNFRDTTDADILNKLRQDIESAKAGSTSQNNFTLNYISPNADTIDITDAITVNGNLQSASDTIDITDAVVQTNVNTGLFQVEDDSSYQKLWLSFDNDVVDKSGNNNSGTITGTETYVSGAISYPDGRYNKAFSFNGSTGLSASDAILPNGNNAWSIAFWINPSVVDPCIGSWGSPGAGNDVEFIVASGKLNVGTYGTANILVSNNSVPLNRWTHIVITFDGSNIRASFNGVQDSLASHTYAIVRYSLYLGTFYNISSYATMLLDDLQIWNYALSSSDITTLYNGQQITHNGSVSPVAKVEFCDCAA